MHALLGALASTLLVVGLASASDGEPSQFSRHAAMRADAGAADKDHQSGTPTNGEHHGSQTEKMKACNHEASTKNLHGDERKAFMSHCLKGEKKS